MLGRRGASGAAGEGRDAHVVCEHREAEPARVGPVGAGLADGSVLLQSATVPRDASVAPIPEERLDSYSNWSALVNNATDNEYPTAFKEYVREVVILGTLGIATPSNENSTDERLWRVLAELCRLAHRAAGLSGSARAARPHG